MSEVLTTPWPDFPADIEFYRYQGIIMAVVDRNECWEWRKVYEAGGGTRYAWHYYPTTGEYHFARHHGRRITPEEAWMIVAPTVPEGL